MIKIRKILLSLITISLVAAAGIFATKAYFTDTEQVLGNSISTGTIDIAIDRTSEQSFSINHLKPGYTGYIDLRINNNGDNPVNALKKLHISSDSGNLQTVIKYDENVELFNPSNELVWHQMLYNQNKTLAEIHDQDQFLGMIPVGYYMKVRQSYHMDTTAGNDYQNRILGFDMTITGEQLTGTLTMLPKSGDPNWQWVLGGATGTLTYGVMDSTFDFTFIGTAPLPSTNYSLIAYEESWSIPSGSGWPRPVVILGSGTSSGTNNISITGSPDTGNMTNVKIWLVKTADLSGSTLSGWNPSAYLFETGLIDYYKSI